MLIQSILTRSDGTQCVQDWSMPQETLTDAMNAIDALFCRIMLPGEMLTLEPIKATPHQLVQAGHQIERQYGACAS